MLPSPPPIGRPLAVRRAIVRDPGSGEWISLTSVRETLVADRLDQVHEVVERAEAAAAAGHWVVGFVSYDAGPAFDPAVHSHRAVDVPLAVFGVFDTAELDPVDGGFFDCGPWSDSITRDEFCAGVDAVKQAIAAGDTYQVNLTYRRTARFEGSALGLFRGLMAAQRAPYGVYLDLGDAALCSASPELFLRREPLGDGRSRLTSLPMKGTRPRGVDAADDDRLAAELAASEKDRAENTMILDMMRNDLGRVAEVGSLEVPALHTVERYPTVLQMTSTVTARSSATLPEIFRATFPPASITGAPKYRTTELVTELETTARGAYTGAAGVIAPGGQAVFNVAIRTVWVDQLAGTATYGVGGGIVWDSVPADEWDETVVKTRVLVAATEPDRLLETMAWYPGSGVAQLDQHLARLRSSAAALGRPVDLDLVVDRLESIDHPGPLRLRLLVGREGEIELQCDPLVADPFVGLRAVRLADRPVSSSDPTLAHKTTQRHGYEHHRATMGDAFDVILWNERGEVTETTIGNLVVELDGRLVTPPVESGLLPGTLRAELLALDKIVEAVVTVADLERADALFMINSVRGWVPLELHGDPSASD